MLRMPGGCFEQTSSSAYPNILVGRLHQEDEEGFSRALMKAEQYLNVGYQRLLTFEHKAAASIGGAAGAPLIG